MRSKADIAAAYTRLEMEAPNVFASDDIVMRSIRGLAARSGGRSSIDMSEEAAMRSLERLTVSVDQAWTARKLCEEAIGVINEDDFHLLDAAISVAQGCLRIPNHRLQAGVPNDVAYVFSTLSVRAQATCHEISALLRAGFPGGARARWRTLHEVAVTSSVLKLGNRYTATRFKNHRWVMLARDRAHDADLPAWSGGVSPEVMRERLVRRYGPEYANVYGWAAPVTTRWLKVARPKWRDLVKVADLADGHRPRVKQAHHSVHVDSLGGQDLLDASGLLHAGGRVDGARPIVWQTVRSLAEATDSLLGIWQRYDATPMIAASRAYADRMLFEIETEVFRTPKYS